MAGRKWSILFAFIILLIVMEAAIVYGEGNSNEYGKDQGNEKVIKEKKPEEEKKPIEEKKPKEEEKKPKEEEKKPKEEEKKPKGEEKKPEEVKKPKEEKPKKDEKPKEVKPKEDKKPKEEKKPKEVKPKEEKKPKEVKPKEDKKPKEEKNPKEVKPKKEKKPKEEKPKKEKNPKEVKPKKEKNPKHGYDQSSDYEELTPQSGFERGLCRANSTCHFKTLRCPNECPVRKPKKNKKQKACFLDCSSKCESTCKVRKANCDGYGSLCYDPRFVGGDGVIFYFHGAKGGNFAIISDDEFQINAHFIGTRPQGRTRDYTWVQALAVMFDTHTLDIAAKRVSQWDENVDSLLVKWNGKAINIPTDGDAEWRTNVDDRDVVVERTDDVNSVRVTISGLLEMDIRVRPIGEKENKAHNYQLPADDSYAHLETQFRFKNLSDSVEGVLGQTYRPAYVSPVKRGVAMPMMGGEDKYQTLSLYSTTCNLCKFKRPSAVASSEGLIAQY